MFWSTHLQLISAKAYNALRLIKRTFNLHFSHTKRLLYLLLVRPHLTYCCKLWHPCLIKDISRIELRELPNSFWVIIHLPIKTESPNYLDVIFLVKLLKFPDVYPNLSKYLVVSNINTIASCTFSKLSTSFFNCIVRLWNVLPVIDISKSLETIKFHLHSFFRLILLLILILVHFTLSVLVPDVAIIYT